jgi:hypothetical protein
MRHIARVLAKILFFFGGAAVLGWVVMALWNAIVPPLFAGARPIDYLHALGLLVLSRILFGGIRGHGGWHRRGHWRRWQAMTAEEREQFKQSALSARCNRGAR